MAVAFGSAGTYYPDTSASAQNAPFAVPTGVAAGDIIIYEMVWYTGGGATIGTLTLPSGFANVMSGTAPVMSVTGAGADNFDVYLFWKRATGADTGTYTASWTGTSNVATGQCFRYTGVAATGNPFDGTPATLVNSTASTARGPVSLTTATANTLLLYWSFNMNTTGGFSGPTAFSAERGTSQGQSSLKDLARATAGSGTAVSSTTNSSVGGAVLLALASVVSASFGEPRWRRTTGANLAVQSWRNVGGVATATPRLTRATGGAQPAFMVGVVSNSDPGNQLPRAQAVGCRIMRIEFTYSDSVATLKPVFDQAASLGIRVQPLAGWSDGSNPVPDLSNLVNWAAAFGPGGTNWPGGVTALPMLAIELGNENSYPYKSGAYTSTTYSQIAQSYGSRVAALQSALAASSNAAARAVGTVVELDDGWSPAGDPTWINNVKIGGGLSVLTNMIAPVTHPYGNDYMTRINRLYGYLVAAGGAKPYYVTEYGIATDNGVSLVPNNGGWPVNSTYSTAATNLNTVASDMQSSGKVGQMMIFQMSDQAASGATTDREKYFGIVHDTGAAKGAYTTTAQSLMTAG